LPTWYGHRIKLDSHPSLPSFPSVRGLIAPARTSLDVPQTNFMSWQLKKSSGGTFISEGAQCRCHLGTEGNKGNEEFKN
jgi:hypothetical protein